jgi:Alr-MurF fusion protein
MRYTIQQIAGIVGGEFLDPGPHDAIIEHLLLDSRQVIFPATSLFIALQGRRHDGHEFLEELYRSGVRNFIISKKEAAHHPHPPAPLEEGEVPWLNFILVENTHAAFHRLAQFHRRQFILPVIGITGSNGKTIVKEWLYQLLHEDYHIVRSPKSFNSQTGVPLSVLQITPEHDLGIFEAGISQMGEMEKLAPILDPDIGIFTTIGEAHSEGFPGIETKLRQKLILFKNAKTLIYSVDNELIEREMKSLTAPRHFTWSATGKPADVQITQIQTTGNFTELTAQSSLPDLSGQAIPHPSSLKIPFTDAASLENALHCLALLLHLGVTPETIARRMARLEPVAMRLELKQGLNNCTVINDSYNSDLTSLNIALNFLEQQSKAPKRTVILSDILQSGQSPEELYGTVAKLLLEKRIGRLIGIGQEVAILETLLPAGFDARFYENTPAFLEDFHRLIFRDEIILLKGARRFEFERIANRLALRFHKTVLEVNLGALLHNLRVYQGHLRPGTKMMVMVKAGAYGSGSAEVAKLLEFQHVDYLGVAYADEGVELRKAGIQLPIMVMNPEEATFDALVRYRLEPEIYSLDLLKNFIDFIKTSQFQSTGDGNSGEGLGLPTAGLRTANYPIHLKLDTGMHRLGFEEPDLDAVIEQIVNRQSSIVIRTIFSHLAASESPAHDAFTLEQIARFKKMAERLSDGLGYRPLRHSGGIVRFPEHQMEMVRLGIGLYGIDSSELLQDRLQTVNTLKATISQIKHLAPGETVGYGRMGKAERPMRIATISLGYADGLLRRAGNGHYSFLIRGKKAPVFGNVCMDMTMANVTDIPEARVGDPAVIFGKDQPVQELAACLGTIPYEIFTGISDRVKRVYVQE